MCILCHAGIQCPGVPAGNEVSTQADCVALCSPWRQTAYKINKCVRSLHILSRTKLSGNRGMSCVNRQVTKVCVCVRLCLCVCVCVCVHLP